MGIFKAVLLGALPLLILIGIAIIACYSGSFFGGGSDYRVLSSFPSPNEAYVATLWQGMGGGAAGWCSQRLSINTKADPFNLEMEQEHGGYVFSVSCDSKVVIDWSNNTELHISYTIGNGVSAYQSPTSGDSDVKIIYEIKN